MMIMMIVRHPSVTHTAAQSPIMHTPSCLRSLTNNVWRERVHKNIKSAGSIHDMSVLANVKLSSVWPSGIAVWIRAHMSWIIEVTSVGGWRRHSTHVVMKLKPGFHYSSWRAVLTARQTRVVETGLYSHKPSGRLPLYNVLSIRTAVTFPAEERHRPLTSTKLHLHCFVTEAHVCEQPAQGRYMKVKRSGVEPATSKSWVQRLSHFTSTPVNLFTNDKIWNKKYIFASRQPAMLYVSIY